MLRMPDVFCLRRYLMPDQFGEAGQSGIVRKPHFYDILPHDVAVLELWHPHPLGGDIVGRH